MLDRRPSVKKQPELTDKTRNKIANAFCQIYANTPIEKVFVKDVMKLAGYNRSTFYQYFEDIYSLREYVENDVLKSIKFRMKESGNSANELLQFYEEKEEILKALFGNYGSIHFLNKLKNELLPYVELQLSNIPEKYRAYIEEFHINTTVSLFRLWISRNKDIGQEELFELIHILYNNGCTAVEILG